jgi:hypothetical protein
VAIPSTPAARNVANAISSLLVKVVEAVRGAHEHRVERVPADDEPREHERTRLALIEQGPRHERRGRDERERDDEAEPHVHAQAGVLDAPRLVGLLGGEPRDGLDRPGHEDVVHERRDVRDQAVPAERAAREDRGQADLHHEPDHHEVELGERDVDDAPPSGGGRRRSHLGGLAASCGGAGNGRANAAIGARSGSGRCDALALVR